MAALAPYAWLLLALGALLPAQRAFHHYLQAVLLLTLQSSKLAFYAYALLFFPGVALHELSHFAAAHLLGVRVHGFSLLPSKQRDGLIRFGYVETGATDPVRGALIGSAPLLTGSLVLTSIGFRLLGLDAFAGGLLQGDWEGARLSLESLLGISDLAVWAYLILAVSNTMLPSASDRASWLPALGLLLALGTLLLLSGFASPLLEWVAPAAAAVGRALASVFTLAAILDLVSIPPLWVLKRGLMALTGLEITRQR